jgi:hypothetical protein
VTSTWTFVCENSGWPKLKRLPSARLASLKNPRIKFVEGGIKLEVQFSYRQGDWTLASQGGTFETFPLSCLPALLELARQMRRGSEP